MKKILFGKLKTEVFSFFNEGNQRSIRAKKHIVYSFFLKGISILVGLIYVPVLIDYLDAERYGVWLTLSSIIGWFSFFNLGLGNGLRNHFTKALAQGNEPLAKKLVSTTYAILGIVFGSIILIFWGVNQYLDWTKILNTDLIAGKELTTLALIVFTFFCLRFICDIIAVILRADQRPALASAFGPIGNVIVLGIIYILIKIGAKSSLITLGGLLSIVPVLVLLFASVILFHGRYKRYRPELKDVDFFYARDLMSLGLKFFVIQVAALIFFSSSNIIITQVLGAEEVAVYNIAYKYFSIPLMGLSIMMTPIWSAVTDAYHRKDYSWLKNTMTKLNRISVLFAVGVVVLLVTSSFAYNLWLGDRIAIPLSVSGTMAVFFIVKILLTPYSNFINGFGKLKIGMLLVIIQSVIFIPMAILLTKILGIMGVIIASISINLLGLIFQPIQVKKIIAQKAKGIWDA